MKRDLPNVYANPLNKKVNNVQEYFYGNENKVSDRSFNANDILKKINKIFNSSHHVYKSRVRIITSEGEIEKDIVGKANGNLLTLDGSLIKIIDILDIEKL